MNSIYLKNRKGFIKLTIREWDDIEGEKKWNCQVSKSIKSIENKNRIILKKEKEIIGLDKLSFCKPQVCTFKTFLRCIYISLLFVLFSFESQKRKKVNECKEFFLLHIYFLQPTVVVTKIFNVGIYFFYKFYKVRE